MTYTESIQKTFRKALSMYFSMQKTVKQKLAWGNLYLVPLHFVTCNDTYIWSQVKSEKKCFMKETSVAKYGQEKGVELDDMNPNVSAINHNITSGISYEFIQRIEPINQ